MAKPMMMSSYRFSALAPIAAMLRSATVNAVSTRSQSGVASTTRGENPETARNKAKASAERAGKDFLVPLETY